MQTRTSMMGLKSFKIFKCKLFSRQISRNDHRTITKNADKKKKTATFSINFNQRNYANSDISHFFQSKKNGFFFNAKIFDSMSHTQRDTKKIKLQTLFIFQNKTKSVIKFECAPVVQSEIKSLNRLNLCAEHENRKKARQDKSKGSWLYYCYVLYRASKWQGLWDSQILTQNKPELGCKASSPTIILRPIYEKWL